MVVDGGGAGGGGGGRWWVPKKFSDFAPNFVR